MVSVQEGQIWSLLRELDLACHNWDLVQPNIKNNNNNNVLKKKSLITDHLPSSLLYFFIAAIKSTKELIGNWGVSGRRKKTMTSGHFLFFFFSFIFISWRLITLQYCSGFCHTLTWISHGFTSIPHPNTPSHLPLHPIPLGLPSVHQVRALVSCIQPGLVICFILDNIHVSMLFSWNIPPLPSPTESKSLFCTSVSLFLFCI